jgi:hypothetical protein
VESGFGNEPIALADKQFKEAIAILVTLVLALISILSFLAEAGSG